MFRAFYDKDHKFLKVLSIDYEYDAVIHYGLTNIVFYFEDIKSDDKRSAARMGRAIAFDVCGIIKDIPSMLVYSVERVWLPL